MWISAGVITKRWGRQTVVMKESWHVFCFDVAMIDNMTDTKNCYAISQSTVIVKVFMFFFK